MKTNFLQANIETVSIVATFAVLSVVVLNQSFTLKKDNVSSISTGSIQGQKGNVKAFLATIRYAEGTSGPNGYRTMFTGKQFSSFKDHPKQLQCAYYAGKRLCSDAAGAYQFLSTTWKPLGLPDFSPANQDKGAVMLLEQGGIMPLIKGGRFEEAVFKAGRIWASFPCNAGGRSCYGQPVKSMDKLRTIYQENL
jgi:muramidase (phage lysozyme)